MRSSSGESFNNAVLILTVKKNILPYQYYKRVKYRHALLKKLNAIFNFMEALFFYCYKQR